MNRDVSARYSWRVISFRRKRRRRRAENFACTRTPKGQVSPSMADSTWQLIFRDVNSEAYPRVFIRGRVRAAWSRRES